VTKAEESALRKELAAVKAHNSRLTRLVFALLDLTEAYRFRFARDGKTGNVRPTLLASRQTKR